MNSSSPIAVEVEDESPPSMSACSLRQLTEDALQCFAPEVTGRPLQGGDVTVAPYRFRTPLGRKASTALEDLDLGRLRDFDERDA
jgi:hypothetical protein